MSQANLTHAMRQGLGDVLQKTKSVQDFLRMVENPAIARLFVEPGSESGAMTVRTTHRCACDKEVPVGSLGILQTPYTRAVDSVCNNCPRRRDYQKSVRFVCVVCKETVMFVDPFQAKSGFRFHPGYTYHLDCCPKCVAQTEAADTVKSIIFEEQAFITRNQRK